MAGHAGNGVVQDDHRRVAAVVRDIGEARHAGMHEGGVADHTDCPAFRLFPERLVEAVDRRHGSAHAQGRLNRGERRDCTERVAADVSENSGIQLFQRVEQAAVRAARAHDRRAQGKVLGKSAAFLWRAAKRFRHKVLGVFAADGKQVFPGAGDAERPDMVFHDGIEFFHHDQRVYGCGKAADHLFGQRIGHADLKHGYGISESFPYILIGSGGSDDTYIRFAHFNAVDPGRFRVLNKLCRALLDEWMAALCISRHHDIFGDILLILLYRNGALTGFHDRLGMGHPGAHLEEYRRVELFGNFVSQFGVGERFRRIGGLQHGYFGRDGVMTGILLIL